MNRGPFDTLPQLSKNDALKLLETPLNEIKLASDYYKAVFHLAKYPSPETEQALLDLIRSQSVEFPFLIAKRKAIEVLGQMSCEKAIPDFVNNLRSSDPYIVENSAWALQQTGCKDVGIHNLIGSLIDQPNQNQRVLIQSLAKMGAVSELKKIEKVFNQFDISPGVKGASLAAISALTGRHDNVELLRNYLDLPNQNDRQSAVQDIIDAKEYGLLDAILKTPVSPFFRLRAISLMSSDLLEVGNQLDIINSIDFVLKDDPRYIRIAKSHGSLPSLNFLLDELFNVDFNRCYSALRTLILMNSTHIWLLIKLNLDKFKKDYGALYFALILLRSIEIKDKKNKEDSLELLNHALDKSWPDYMKFKPQAIMTYSFLDFSCFMENIQIWLDENQTPYWASRYAALIGLERLINIKGIAKFKYLIRACINDTNHFVKLKANSIDRHYSH